MSKQPIVVRNGQSGTLSVMGTQVRLLCEADKTDNKWSLMDCVMPKHTGPPPHQHPWDEAYFVVSGQVRFTLHGREVLAGTGDFVYAPANPPHGFQGASEDAGPRPVLRCPRCRGRFLPRCRARSAADAAGPAESPGDRRAPPHPLPPAAAMTGLAATLQRRRPGTPTNSPTRSSSACTSPPRRGPGPCQIRIL